MTHSTNLNGDSVVLEIGGELDAMSVSDLRSTMDRVIADGHRNVIVDLKDLKLIDSSGVGAIVSLYKRVRAQGGSVAIRGVRDQPLAIFRLLRLDDVLLERQAAAI